MFQDLDIRYDNAFRWIQPQEGSTGLIWQGDKILTLPQEGGLAFPCFSQLSPAARALHWHYGFTLGSQAYFYADSDGADLEAIATCSSPIHCDSASAPLERLIPISSKDYRSMAPREAVFAAAVSESLHRWYGANRFCGHCGSPMVDSREERALQCPACGSIVYPKICPAVIVAVTHGDRLLLTRYRGRAFQRYALVAGFAEIGESIEDTVHREVFEETGLRVKNLRYYKSQPWVFTDSLLLGFWCELEGSDAVTLQQSELSEASWHHRHEIPDDHSNISLTGEMIQAFRQGKA